MDDDWKVKAGGARFPLETLHTPWMDVALKEMGASVREMPARDGFVDELRTMLTLGQAIDRGRAVLESTGQKPFGDKAPRAYHLGAPKLGNSAMKTIAEMERPALDRNNRAIGKYFDGVTTDPARDKKGRRFELALSHANDDGHAQVTAWCAAFVNWCLKQAGAPHLGYATARSWLDFGQPVAWPIYGCITIIKPSKDTGSTTGHVAFFCEWQGNRVQLLGGNQSDRVKKSTFPAAWVLGYRWPTNIKYYLDSAMV